MAGLTEEQASLLKGKNFAVVGTVGEDGIPQLTINWIDWDGERVVFNTAEGRAKPRLIRANPNAGLTIVDPEDPYRWVAVSGPAEMTEEGAAEHINQLSHKYRGRDYNLPAGQQRLIVRIKPQRVTAYGLD